MIRGFIAASLDGYIADPQGSVTFLAPYEDEPAGYDSFIATVGTRRIAQQCAYPPGFQARLQTTADITHSDNPDGAVAQIETVTFGQQHQG